MRGGGTSFLTTDVQTRNPQETNAMTTDESNATTDTPAATDPGDDEPTAPPARIGGFTYGDGTVYGDAGEEQTP